MHPSSATEGFREKKKGRRERYNVRDDVGTRPNVDTNPPLLALVGALNYTPSRKTDNLLSVVVSSVTIT